MHTGSVDQKLSYGTVFKTIDAEIKAVCLHTKNQLFYLLDEKTLATFLHFVFKKKISLTELEKGGVRSLAVNRNNPIKNVLNMFIYSFPT